jgi:mRNA-degrading endonuclease HigB of HigAB toxin-antitoxin module
VVNIRNFAEHIVEDIISTMKAKAVELADKEVMVDINGNEVR